MKYFTVFTVNMKMYTVNAPTCFSVENDSIWLFMPDNVQSSILHT